MTDRTEVGFEEFPVSGSVTGSFLGVQLSAPSGSQLTLGAFKGPVGIIHLDPNVQFRVNQTASLTATDQGLVAKKTFATSGSLVALTDMTASSFFATDLNEVGFVGSASFAPQSDSSSFAATASNVGPGGIISGASLVVADVAPTVIGLNSTLGSFTNLTGIDGTVAELGDGLTRLKLDLEDFNQTRISIATDTIDDKGASPQLAAQWSVDQSSWEFFTETSQSAGAFLTQSNAVVESNFTALVSESKSDVFVRVVTYNGPSIGPGAAAKIGSIFIQFR